MIAPYLKFLLKKDVYTTVQLTVPPHELALLNVRFGSEVITDIVPTGQMTHDINIGEEYERLRRQYRNAGDGRPWVEVAFGHLHEGRMEAVLERGTEKYMAELAALVEEPKPKAKKRPSRKKRPNATSDTAATPH